MISATKLVSLCCLAGMALLFYSLKPTGESDYSSMHTGCPVIDGIKWTATKWIHTGPFHEEWINSPESTDQKRDPEICMDYDERCSGWVISLPMLPVH